jgi:phosphate transport system substrate-binding protein
MKPALLICLATVICAAEGGIIYDGSSTVYPIIIAASEAYTAIDPRFALTAKPTGSSAGFRSMLAKTSTINGASRAINAKELKAAAEAGIGFLEVPIAFDALSIMANPRNAWLKSLTTVELQTIFAQGGPTSWKQVRADFPDARIALYGPGSDSGTLDYFNEAIMGKDKHIRADYVGSEDDHILVQGVASNINAIGFMGLAYLVENAQMVRAVAVDHGAGPVMPNSQTVIDGTYSPLSRPIFVYVRTDQIGRADVVGFIEFLLDKPDLIASVGYVPLPTSMRSEIKSRFAKRTTGSIFTSVAVGTSLGQAMGIETSSTTAAAPPQPAVALAHEVRPAVATQPAAQAWTGPDAVTYQRDIDRLRAAALDLARRSLDDMATVEELARRSAELQAQTAALADSFRTAPRRGPDGLSLAEAESLTR